MKYVLFAAALAAFSLAQANKADMESLCAARPPMWAYAPSSNRHLPVRQIVGGGGKGPAAAQFPVRVKKRSSMACKFKLTHPPS